MLFKRQGGRWPRITAALIAATAAFAAGASPLPDGSTVSATLLSGPTTAAGLLSINDGYTATSNPSVASVSSAFGDLEFITDDYAIALDWASDGTLTIWNNAGGPLGGDYSFSLALGGHLVAFTDFFGKGLSITQQGDVLNVTVLAGAFTSSYDSVVAGTAEVPEPAGWALAMTGLLAAGAARRRSVR